MFRKVATRKVANAATTCLWLRAECFIIALHISAYMETKTDTHEKSSRNTHGLDVFVSVWVVGSLYGCVLMFSTDLSVVNAVAMVMVTHPSPPTLVILSLKSTELWLGGFHFRMSSHLPGLYFYRDSTHRDQLTLWYKPNKAVKTSLLYYL